MGDDGHQHEQEPEQEGVHRYAIGPGRRPSDRARGARPGCDLAADRDGAAARDGVPLRGRPVDEFQPSLARRRANRLPVRSGIVLSACVSCAHRPSFVGLRG